MSRRRGTQASGHPLAVDVERDGARATVRLAGDLDAAGASVLRPTLLGLADTAGCEVVVDVDGVAFVDSGGIGVLVAGMKRLRSHHGDLKLRNVRPAFAKLLTTTGLAAVFDANG